MKARAHKGDRLYKRYDWGDLCVAFGAGFVTCFMLFIYLLTR